MTRYLLIIFFFASSAIAASELTCERRQSAMALETIKYSVCLLREKKYSDRYVGIRYSRQNISKEMIRLYLRDLQSPWRYEIRLKQEDREVFSASQRVFDVDMWVSVSPLSKLVSIMPNEIIEGDLFFSEIRQELKKTLSKVELKSHFSIWFSIFPGFLRGNEDFSERDAVLMRDKERILLKSEFLPPYSNVFINWRFKKRK
jgi:hypothetical protein